MARLCAALVLALGCANAAAAVDLDALSTADKRLYCYGYVHIDLMLQREAGVIDEAEFRRQDIAAAGAVMRRAGNANYAAAERRAIQAVRAIVAEKPSAREFTAQVRFCRKFLRL